MQVWLHELTTKTQEIVRENWKFIETLAKQLIEDEQVDEKTLDEILRKLAKNLLMLLLGEK